VLRELEEDPDATLPEKGLFSLPFMKRAINRKRQAVQDEAQRLAQELGQRASDSEDDEGGVDGAMDWGEGEVAGEDGKEPVARRTFGPGRVKRGRVPLPAGGDGEGEDDAFEGSSGSEDEKETPQPSLKRKALAKNRVKLEGQKLQPRGKVMATAGPFSVEVPPAEPLSLPSGQPEWLFPGAKAKRETRAIEQAAVAGGEGGSGSSRKKQRRAPGGGVAVEGPPAAAQGGGDGDGGDGSPDADDQRDLVRQAFQMFGEDVQADFAAEKQKDVEKELPKNDGPTQMPGWGMWKDQQRVPAWMLRERAAAEKKRADAAARRKDAKLKNVIISERFDKKADKFSVQEVPYPFKSREDYERSVRMPIGREFMTDKVHRDMTRPAVLKTTGVMIDPLRHLGESLDNRKLKPGGGQNVKKARPERPKSGRL
jgi:U3 small nucleolar RNA-associated protein 14